MKQRFPKTYAYLKRFEPQLRKRASSSVRRLMDTGAFYSMFAVGPYTMTDWKVMWPEVGHTVRAGVCGPRRVESEKCALPDHTIIFVPCESEAEADYIAGALNSSPAQAAVTGYIVLHPSPHVLEHINIPKYKPRDKIHNAIAKLAAKCRREAANDGLAQLARHESELDQVAAELWGITPDELSAIRAELSPESESDEEAEAKED